MERFKPEEGEEYHFLDSFGARCFVCWKGAGEDQFRYDSGNCFKTSQEAQAKIDRDKAIASGRAVVVNVPEGWEVDGIVGNGGQVGLSGNEKKSGILHVHIKRTAPPPPKEVTLKVYNVKEHGEPDTVRWPWWIKDTGSYIYLDETEGL